MYDSLISPRKLFVGREKPWKLPRRWRTFRHLSSEENKRTPCDAHMSIIDRKVTLATSREDIKRNKARRRKVCYSCSWLVQIRIYVYIERPEGLEQSETRGRVRLLIRRHPKRSAARSVQGRPPPRFATRAKSAGSRTPANRILEEPIISSESLIA